MRMKLTLFLHGISCLLLLSYSLIAQAKSVISDDKDSNEVDEFRPFVQMTKGQNAVLNCDFGFNQNVNWKKIDGELSEYARFYRGQLLIYDVTEKDGGEYICSLEDGRTSRVVLEVKSAQPSVKTRLLKNEVLELLTQPSSLTIIDINEGEKAEMNCLFFDSYDYQIYSVNWKKLNGELSSRASENENILIIDNAQKEDQGEYECSISDSDNPLIFRLNVNSNVRPNYFTEVDTTSNNHQSEEIDSVLRSSGSTHESLSDTSVDTTTIAENIDGDFSSVTDSTHSNPNTECENCESSTSTEPDYYDIKEIETTEQPEAYHTSTEEPYHTSTEEPYHSYTEKPYHSYTEEPYYTSTQDYHLDDSCFCNNHSRDCTCSGRCYSCQHNTYGDKCQYCLPGYIGDATKGTPNDCWPGFSPTITTQITTLLSTTTTTTTTPRYEPEPDEHCFCNNHSNECTCSGRCFKCLHNTYGDKCQYCLPGFVGDATKGTELDCVPEQYEVQTTTLPVTRNTCQCEETTTTTASYNCPCKNLIDPRKYFIINFSILNKLCPYGTNDQFCERLVRILASQGDENY